MMKLKAVIFDLDGTIADTLPLCIAAFKKSIEPLLGKTLSEQDIIKTFGPSEEGTIRKLIPQHQEQGLRDYLYHYENLHGICPAAFPGIREVLDLLQQNGVHLAMVTGKGMSSAVLSLKQFGMMNDFEVLETGSPDGPDKVNGIRRALQKLNVSTQESIYAGDAPSDIKYCKEIGIPVAAAAWAGTANAAELLPLQPEFIFYNVEDFRNWITDTLSNSPA